VDSRRPSRGRLADGLDRVRPHDDFFDVGGHSLVAVRATRELTRRTGVTVSPGMILAAADVTALADRIAGAGSRRDPAPG
jgi:hypothetical protein